MKRRDKILFLKENKELKKKKKKIIKLYYVSNNK